MKRKVVNCIKNGSKHVPVILAIKVLMYLFIGKGSDELETCRFLRVLSNLLVDYFKVG